MDKKNVLRKTAVGLCVLLLLTASGCKGGEKSGVKTTPLGSGDKISEEPTTLDLFMISSGDKHLEDLEVWQQIAKDTNVTLHTVSSKSASDEDTAFNTLMASGDLPDLVIYNKAKQAFPKYGMEGAFEPLDDLIKEYAPNVEKQLEDADVRAYVTASDNKIYFLTGVNPRTVASGWFIRQDWLDKLGLKSPTTVEEYYNVLKAFRDGDPNGNGIKDEVPYFSRFAGVDHLVLLFNTIQNWELRDGKVVYGPTTPEFKTAYENISKWYAEGLIDKEIYTRGSKSRDKLFGENLGGSTHDWFGSTAQFNTILKDTVPGFDVEAIAPPNGKEYTSRDRTTYSGIALASSSEKKEVGIRFIDYMFSEKGQRYSNFGIEGKHYDMEGDYPKFQDWVVHGDKTAIDILNESGACLGFPSVQDFRYEEQWLVPAAKKGVDLYLDNNYLVDPFPTLSYIDDEEEKLNKIMTDVRTYLDETTQKWVFGSANVDDEIDAFNVQLKKLGIDEATEIQQKAYERYLKLKDNK